MHIEFYAIRSISVNSTINTMSERLISNTYLDHGVQSSSGVDLSPCLPPSHNLQTRQLRKTPGVETPRSGDQKGHTSLGSGKTLDQVGEG